MLIDPQHEGAPGLDFETGGGNNASVARDHSPEVGQCPEFRLMLSAPDFRRHGRLPGQIRLAGIFSYVLSREERASTVV